MKGRRVDRALSSLPGSFYYEFGFYLSSIELNCVELCSVDGLNYCWFGTIRKITIVLPVTPRSILLTPKDCPLLEHEHEIGQELSIYNYASLHQTRLSQAAAKWT